RGLPGCYEAEEDAGRLGEPAGETLTPPEDNLKMEAPDGHDGDILFGAPGATVQGKRHDGSQRHADSGRCSVGGGTATGGLRGTAPPGHGAKVHYCATCHYKNEVGKEATFLIRLSVERGRVSARS